MSTKQSAFGAALDNVAHEICRVGEARGPVTLIVNGEGNNDVIVQVKKLSDGSIVSLNDDTTRTLQAFTPAYTGNTVLLDFTGSISYVYLVPGTVHVIPTSGGNSVNAADDDADGILYATISAVKTAVGTVNYFTGAIELHYPAGSEPNTGAIRWTAHTTAAPTKAHGKTSKRVSNLPPAETYIVSACAKKGSGSCTLRIDAIVSF